MKITPKTMSRSYRFHPVLSTLALSLVLAGCATPPAPNETSSQLVVHTSTGQGWRQEASPGTTASPLPEPAPRARTASRRPSSQNQNTPPAPAAAANRKASAENTMLNFVGADLQGVVRALARFTG